MLMVLQFSLVSRYYKKLTSVHFSWRLAQCQSKRVYSRSSVVADECLVPGDAVQCTFILRPFYLVYASAPSLSV